eukprot:scaffold6807_cov70-Phaeocystis_antarctica.AAC.7
MQAHLRATLAAALPGHGTRAASALALAPAPPQADSRPKGRGGCGGWPLRGEKNRPERGVCIEMGWRHDGDTLYFGCCVSGTARRLVRGSASTTTTTTTTHFYV